MGVLDNMFSDSAIDIAEMEREKKEREEAAKANRGKTKFISELKLNDKTPTASVVFLNEGFKVHAHSVKDFRNGYEVYLKVLCKNQKCELCSSGYTKGNYAMYAVIDMSHSYINKKTGEVVTKPTFKTMLRGIETIKVIERRRQKLKDKSLTGKLWEAQLSGSGFSTYYDFTLEEEGIELDFEETETIETKDGSIEVPAISLPTGWYDYQEDPEKINIYTKSKLKPAYEIDWSNSKHVDEWLKHHLLQTPLVDYVKYGSKAPSKSDDKKVKPAVSEASNDDDTDY